MRRLILVGLLILAACDREAAPSPSPATAAATANAATPAEDAKQVMLSYYASMSAEKWADAYALVSPGDQAARGLDEFTLAVSDPLQMAILSRRSYEILDVSVEGDRARIRMDTTGPDISKVQKFVLSKHLTNNPKLPDARGLKDLTREAVLTPDIPMIVTQQTVLLVRTSEGEWRLDFDWDGEKIGRGVPKQIRVKPARDGGSAASDQ